jgi:hypothetical protein
MNLLREYIRSLLIETAIDPRIMKMIDRVENEGLIIDVSSYSGRGFGSVEIEDASGNLLGGVDYEKPDWTDGFCYGSMMVAGSKAQGGLGPLLYDIAIEATGGLMSDRTEVSGEAEAVWDKYMLTRPDVKVIQLDVTDEFVDELDGITKLTPDEPADDCSQVPAYDRHGKKWFESSLAKKYMKNGTPVMDELRKRGLIA